MHGGKRYKPRLHIGRCRHPKSAVWRIEEVIDSNGQLMRLLHTRHNTPFTFVAEALLDLVRVKKSFYASLAQLVEQGTLNAWVQGSSPWWGTINKTCDYNTVWLVCWLAMSDTWVQIPLVALNRCAQQTS